MSRYTKKERVGQLVFIFCVLLAIVIGLIWNLIDENNRTVKPDVVYPMTNVNVSWLETYHFGSWEG